MITKLLKYETKCIFCYSRAMYCSYYVFAILTNLIILISKRVEFLEVLVLVFQIMFFIWTLIVIFGAFFIPILRFYTSMVADEAYQTFSLPFSVARLINTKITISLISNLLGIFSAIIGFFFVFMGDSSELFSIIWKYIVIDLKIKSAIFFMSTFLLLLLSLLTYNLFVFAAIGIGQTSVKNKIGSSFIAGVIMYLVLVNGGTLILLLIFNQFGNMAEFSLGWFSIICMVLFGCLDVVLYLASTYLFRTKLNLE